METPVTEEPAPMFKTTSTVDAPGLAPIQSSNGEGAMTAKIVSIDYAIPRKSEAGYHPLFAVLLCTPGLLCWLLLVAMMSRAMPDFFIGRAFPGGVVVLVLSAILTAVFSIVHYFLPSGLRRPWYVILNLVINISGLLFLGGIVCLFLCA
jgi:hypothetical protein